MRKCIVPHYYKNFTCIADRCVHNCCKGGWLIELTKDMVSKYENIPGEFGKQLRDSVVVDEEGSYVFRLKDGVCPHLDEKGLCSIYGAVGEEYMGTVCREFPRFSCFYGNTVETGIGLACEEAGRILLSDISPFSMVEMDPKKTGIVLPEEMQDLEDEIYTDYLKSAREHIFCLLWKSELSVNEKILALLDMSEELQHHINCGNYNEVEEFAGKVNRIGYNMEEDKGLCRETKKLLVSIYRNLEQLNEEWSSRAEKIEECVLDGTYKNVLDGVENGETMKLQLLSYFIFRYFMKGVEDYNVSDKIRLCVCNYLMLMAQFAALGREKELSLENLIEEARIFSRQVEYSDSNIECLFEELNFGDELSESRIKLLFLE